MNKKKNSVQSLQSAAAPICPVSRSRAVVPLCEVGGYQVWRCPESATDFVWPIPTDAQLKQYYDRKDWFEGGEVGGYADYDRQTEFSLPMVESILDSFADDGVVRYVLDVGCGYGTHLKLAADRGWKCFGVELSEHARETAINRHGDAMYIVEKPEQLVPHEFDLVLMLDVLEHVGDPYALLFGLFNQGLIGPKTRLIVSTPNARSSDAVAEPDKWEYRHPPSHLVYFSARSLKRLFATLLFEEIRVVGTSPIAIRTQGALVDEHLTDDEALGGFAGLLCEAHGSHFYAFMQERYVPGTWSRLAEYEHMPRYQFACQFATDRAVLDFGCGTGYGSRLLADVAAGVVGLDIDAEALRWATTWHDSSRLRFDRRGDLGAGLSSQSFDLVTCFEMIEHVDHATQIETIRNIARLVKRDGSLVISTPNPEVTANYGANPFHLREMSEAQFRELLAPFFAHVTVLRQWIRPSVLIGSIAEPKRRTIVAERLRSTVIQEEPAAFIAVCSHQAPLVPSPFFALDSSFDFVHLELQRQQAETALRFANYALREKALDAKQLAKQYSTAYETQIAAIGKKDHDFELQAETLGKLENYRVEKEAAFAEQERQIALLNVLIFENHESLQARDDDLQEQAGTIAELQQRVAGKDEALHEQAARLQELNAYRIGKEAAFAEQATDITALRQNMNALEMQHASLIGALDDAQQRCAASEQQVATFEPYRVEKERAVNEQASLIEALHRALASHVQQIAELNQQLNIKANELAIQGESLIEAAAYRKEKETAFAIQAQTIVQMREGFDAQAATISKLTQEGVGMKSAMAQVHANAATAQQLLNSLNEKLLVERVRGNELEAESNEQKSAFEAAIEIVSELEQSRIEATARIAMQMQEHQSLSEALANNRSELEQGERERAGQARLIAAFENSRAVKLSQLVKGVSRGGRDKASAVYREAGRLVIPKIVRSRVSPWLRGVRERRDTLPASRPDFKAYVVQLPKAVDSNRPRVLHAIANFMTGGSSRLVVDLLERLGDRYEQRILTSFSPDPPEYTGIDIAVLPMGTARVAFEAAITSFDPHLVHVHYWGDYDEPWYREVFHTAAEQGRRIVQNVNTPVSPFTEVKTARDVFVSRYVLEHFGCNSSHSEVIYPGSDFSYFEFWPETLYNNCVGMVYRLENDKLNESAIDVFIQIAVTRPGVKCLIVGGGSLLEPFMSRVRTAGCEASFEFTGYVSYERLPDLYRRMGIFIAPVWKESFGQVSPFAMNVGMPVIGYNVGAIPEIVDDPSLIAPAGDAAALAEIAVALLDNRERRQRIMVFNRKRAAELFSVEAMIERYSDLYAQVVVPVK